MTEYALPPTDVVEMLDAPPTPVAIMSPDRTAMLLVDYEPYPPISLLARPLLRLGGQRIDPALGCLQRTVRFTGITVVSVTDGARVRVGLPEEARIGLPVWSPDGTRLAFTRDREDGVELWLADTATGDARPVPDVLVCDVLCSPTMLDPIGGAAVADPPFTWSRDGRFLLVRAVPPGRGPAPAAPLVPAGPRTQETAGKRSQMATFQDLLEDERDEALFEHFATVRLARVAAANGAATPLGAPGMIASVRESPDGRHLLVARVRRPFSFRVPFPYFARTTEVWDTAGAVVAMVADLPVSDEVPRQGVPTGPRGVTWQERRDATLLWSEALDGGDPTVKVPHRDRVMTLAAPFTAAPRELLRATHRVVRWDWTDRPDEALLTEFDRDRRWRTTWLLDLSQPEETKRVLFDLSVHDDYGDPGEPVYQVKPDGARTMVQDGDRVYLAGRGASDAGDRPFLDRLDLRTAEKERLFRCDEVSYERFIAFAGGSRAAIVTCREAPGEPPNYFVLDLGTGARRALTDFPDPHPRFTGVKKELVRYTRADGVPLSGTLYLPPDRRPGERVPVLIWAYPLDYSDPATAGQVRGSDNTFTRLGGASPLWFVTQGYAVLNDAQMPVVGDPETMNDTYVEQIVAAARAAIDKLDAMGIVDRERVVAAGHSYGAFMTANLLAHSDLFAAGIARSGAYNRTLTPFGFQTERRSYWEAPEVYHRVSPFRYAHQITAPLLLIHGEVDNNSGTFPVQSERMYQALQATGGTARLVLLPHESHGYRARESVLHVLAEMFAWAGRYATGRAGTQSASAAD